MARTSDGRYVVAPTDVEASLAVYASDGKLLKVLEKAGAAPGEYRTIDELIGHGDSLLLVDRGNARLTVLDDNLQLRGTMSVAGPTGELTPIQSGLLVWSRIPNTPVFKVFDSAGSALNAFGPVWSPVDPGEGVEVAAGSNGDVYVVSRRTYRIDVYARDGQLREQVQQNRPWFVSHEGMSPIIDDAFFDSTGLLWVVFTVPNPSFDRPQNEADRRMTLAEVLERRIVVLEALEPSTWRIVARGRTNHFLRTFVVPTGEIVSYHEDANGVFSLGVWALAIDTSTISRR